MKRPKKGLKTNWHDQRSHSEQGETKRLVVSQVDHAEGPMFRAKRMALGLAVWELGLSMRDYTRLAKLEDGRVPGPWFRYWPVLQEKFEAYVKAYVDLGGDVFDLRLNPWTLKEIGDAAGLVSRVEVEPGLPVPDSA